MVTILQMIFSYKSEMETNARPIASVNKSWARQVENWPGEVEFYIEHIRDICFQVCGSEI